MSVEVYNYQSKEYQLVGVGATLKVWRDSSYRIMSDVWGAADMATYWDAVEKRPKTVCVNVYDYQSAYSEKPRLAEVDATPEVKEEYRKYLIGLAFSDLLDKIKADNAKPVKGSKVKVISGRTAKGTEGIVAVSIERPYGMGYRSVLATKLGIATSDVKVKVAAANGKVYENYRDIVWVWARNVLRTDIASVNEDEVLKLATEKVDATLKTA
jgi:hypothetical protein